MSRRRDGVRDDDGSALVETIVVLCVFLAPLVWVALALLRVEAGAYAVRAAARESARAYVTSASSARARCVPRRLPGWRTPTKESRVAVPPSGARPPHA